MALTASFPSQERSAQIPCAGFVDGGPVGCCCYRLQATLPYGLRATAYRLQAPGSWLLQATAVGECSTCLQILIRDSSSSGTTAGAAEAASQGPGEPGCGPGWPAKRSNVRCLLCCHCCALSISVDGDQVIRCNLMCLFVLPPKWRPAVREGRYGYPGGGVRVWVRYVCVCVGVRVCDQVAMCSDLGRPPIRYHLPSASNPQDVPTHVV